MIWDRERYIAHCNFEFTGREMFCCLLYTSDVYKRQAQINPHMLYNTLETIRWKSYALTDGYNEVVMLLELSLIHISAV